MTAGINQGVARRTGRGTRCSRGFSCSEIQLFCLAEAHMRSMILFGVADGHFASGLATWTANAQLTDA
jgi:hypothetical protein